MTFLILCISHTHCGFNAKRETNFSKTKAVEFTYFCFPDYDKTKTKSNILSKDYWLRCNLNISFFFIMPELFDSEYTLGHINRGNSWGTKKLFLLSHKPLQWENTGFMPASKVVAMDPTVSHTFSLNNSSLFTWLSILLSRNGWYSTLSVQNNGATFKVPLWRLRLNPIYCSVCYLLYLHHICTAAN